MSAGPTSGNRLTYHGAPNRAASAVEVDLTSADPVDVAGTGMIRAHGAVMILAWMGAATSGMMMARYAKETLRKQDRCGKDVWFFDHLLYMVLTLVLSVVGAIIIFVDRGSRPFEKKAVSGWDDT